MRQEHTIAPITTARLDACWTLRLQALREHPEAFGQPYDVAAGMTPAEVREAYDSWWTAGDNQVFVAADPAGNLAGMAGIVRETRPGERHRAKVWGMYVHPASRTHGVGRRLLDASIAWCRSLEGVLQIHLEVESTNHAAIALYRRAGFVTSGTTPRSRIVGGRALDHLHMVYVLDDYHWDSGQTMKGSTR